jgi:hypothetical protein
MSWAPGSASARTPADSTPQSLGIERDGIGALPVGGIGGDSSLDCS